MTRDGARIRPLAAAYAQALYELAEAGGQVQAVAAELEALAAAVERDRALAEFLASPAVDPDRRAASLERSLRGRLCDLLVDALLVMNRHGRLGLLAAVAREYVLRMERAAGQVEVTVVTAVEPDDALRDRIAQVAASLTGRRPLVEYRVDPEILGGLVLSVGDWRYDASLRRRLMVVRERLRERGRRGLRAGVTED